MTVVRLSKVEDNSATTPEVSESENTSWIGVAAGGTLLAAGLLLLAGERRAGIVAAASGTALALLDQKKTLHSWWFSLPGYIEQVQRVVGQVQTTVDEIAVKRESLRQALTQ